MRLALLHLGIRSLLSSCISFIFGQASLDNPVEPYWHKHECIPRSCIDGDLT